MNEPLPDTLYHYTDIHALQEIWEKGAIWGTESFYLNDTTEMIAGLDAAGFALAEKTTVVAAAPKSSDAGKAIQHQLDLQRLRATAELVAELRNSTSYVVSLSENGDQLSQWRAYARAGYCIGFSTEGIRQSLKSWQHLARVRYLDSENAELLAMRSLSAVNDDMDRLASENPYEEAVREYQLSNRLIRESACTKDESFREEREVRIVDTSPLPTLHTAGKYGMTPRISIPLNPGAVTSITVGPGPHTEQRLRSIQQYVARVQFGPDELDAPRPQVNESNIPYRDW